MGYDERHAERRAQLADPPGSPPAAKQPGWPDTVWHLPIDPDRRTYAELIEIAADAVGRNIPYRTVPETGFKILGSFHPSVKEANELLSRYRQDDIFDTTKFANRFADFDVTTYREGITKILGNTAA